MEKTKDNFKCDICNKELEEAFMFGNYGDNPSKIKDSRRFCSRHFDEEDEKYNANSSKNLG